MFIILSYLVWKPPPTKEMRFFSHLPSPGPPAVSCPPPESEEFKILLTCEDTHAKLWRNTSEMKDALNCADVVLHDGLGQPTRIRVWFCFVPSGTLATPHVADSSKNAIETA